MNIARLLCLLAAGALGGAAPVLAQEAGRHPLRLIVPLPAGSTSDVAARLIAERLRDGGRQPVVVDNRPGASGRIAVDALRSAAPDGNTLLLAPVAVPVIIPLVFHVDYDPGRDLAPVSQVSRFAYALAVAPGHPAKTLSGFVAWARANPAQANFGTPGAGSVPHYLGAMLAKSAGAGLVHVAYPGIGTLDAELMNGQLAAAISALSDFGALHRAGKLRVLATSGAKRSPLLPEVPTFREAGYTAVEATGWHGVFAPGGAPQAAIDRWSGAIVAALQVPEVREKFAAIGLEPTGTTPQALAAIVAADTVRWRVIVKATGFTAE